MHAISNRVAAGLAADKTNATKIASLMAAYGPESTEQSASDESPAVIKAISAEGQDSDRTAWHKLLEERGYGHLATMSDEERGERSQGYFDDIKRRMELTGELRLMQYGRENLAENQRVYAKMSASDPVPPKELQGEELEAAFKLMDSLGIARSTFGHDSSIFVNEGTRYLFHRDGRLEAHDADIAPSQEEKTLWLSRLARQIEYGKTDPTDLQTEYDALTAKINSTRSELFRNL